MKRFNLKVTIGLMALMTIVLVSCRKHDAGTTVKALSKNFDSAELTISNQIPYVEKENTGFVEITIPEEEPFIDITEVISDYHYIPLETTDECLIGHISELYSDDSLIFVFDKRNSSAFCFHYDGRFQCKFSAKGRGPEEYINIEDMCIDKKNKEVCLLDYSGSKLLFYDYAGQFIRSTPMYYRYNEIVSKEGDYILGTSIFSNSHLPAIEFNEFIIASSNQTPLYKGFPYPKSFRNNFTMSVEQSLRTTNDNVYFCSLLSDTIWSVSTKECKAEYVIKYPEMTSLFTTSDIQNISNESYENKTEYKYRFTGYFSVTRGFAYFGIVNRLGTIVPLVYCHSTGNVKFGTFMSVRSQDNRLLSNTVSGLRFAMNDTSFVSVLQPNTLLMSAKQREKDGTQFEGKDLQLLKNISEEDNPILLVVKLKDF